ncbi:uncharacterized protein I303_104377 [Kwoniella dejecticola CBS 10117]|uniref:Uncharacterized protein n=1 Tax=Kwoniella dejecticola CBS 10117 TaxID=1296121 RepID=A0A1A6A5H8_9TREE|nr:uncharacterized protein I303_04646 [Kwoniella dejecticola CBS 10117]OBR85311.1 hypothetical protein I303_04646 [Kwoniella dejecticola CBS 10117]
MGLPDRVIPSERPLAETIERYSLEHQDTYEFIARTTKNQIVVQIRYDDENDTIGIEGYFTETKALIDDIERAQEEIVKITKEAGYENYPGVKSLEEMREWRFDGMNFPKKSAPPWGDGPAPWEIEDEVQEGGGRQEGAEDAEGVRKDRQGREAKKEDRVEFKNKDTEDDRGKAA